MCLEQLYSEKLSPSENCLSDRKVVGGGRRCRRWYAQGESRTRDESYLLCDCKRQKKFQRKKLYDTIRFICPRSYFFRHSNDARIKWNTSFSTRNCLLFSFAIHLAISRCWSMSNQIVIIRKMKPIYNQLLYKFYLLIYLLQFFTKLLVKPLLRQISKNVVHSVSYHRPLQRIVSKKKVCVNCSSSTPITSSRC